MNSISSLSFSKKILLFLIKILFSFGSTFNKSVKKFTSFLLILKLALFKTKSLISKLSDISSFIERYILKSLTSAMFLLSFILQHLLQKSVV